MPGLASRARTDSRASIRLTGKCLPMSRRKSIADIGPVQSRLLTSDARSVSSVEVEELRHLAADPLHPAGDDLGGLSTRSVLRPLGSPISPVAPPTRPIGRWPGQLEAAQGQQLHQVADVQRRRGRVEAAIERDRPCGQRRAQLVDVGGLRDQAAPGEVVEDVGHDPCFPMLDRDIYRCRYYACPITALVPPPESSSAGRGDQRVCGGCAYRRRGTCGRYGETVGSPSIQNRQGVSLAPTETPVRGPD